MKPKLVLVEWEDSISRGGWQGIEDYNSGEPAQCRTVGWMTLKDRRKVCLIMTQTGGSVEPVLDALTIPRGCIKSIKYLEE